MPRLNAKKLLFMFLLITILTFSHAKTVQCEDPQAEAEQAINEAFVSVRTAEEAGANVEDLVDKLNTALNLTLEAPAQAIGIADEVRNQADVRKQEALNMLFVHKYKTLIVFVIADAIICIVGVFLIHRWQRRSLMKKKPKLAR